MGDKRLLSRLWVRKLSTHRPCFWPYPLWVPHSVQQARDTSFLRFAPIALTAKTLQKILYFSLLRGTLEKSLFYVSPNAKQHWVPFYTLSELMGIYHFFAPNYRHLQTSTQFPSYYKRLRGGWVELLARYPHLKESLKNLQTINAGGGVEKREPSYTVDRNANWYRNSGEQCGHTLKYWK